MQTRDLYEVEAHLASLFYKNPHLRDMRFIQSLNSILFKNPWILEIAETIDQKGTPSFILIFLEQIFSYSIQYSHPTYLPWFPQNHEEFLLVLKIVELHFPHIKTKIHEAFEKLGGFEKTQVPKYASDEIHPYSFPVLVKTQSPRPVKKKFTSSVLDIEDPGLKESALRGLWNCTFPSGFENLWLNQLHADFPSWARGILSAMDRSYLLYSQLKSSAKMMRVCGDEIRVQPHHRMIQVLVASEFYWQFNKREVDLDRSMPYSRAKELIQGYLHTISDAFFNLLPQDHPVRERTSSKLRRSWIYERISGVKGAQKVSGRYIENSQEYIIDVTSIMLNIKEGRRIEPKLLAGTSQEDLSSLPTRPKLRLIHHPDHGFDQDLVWELYKFKSESPGWDEDAISSAPAWAKGIFKVMKCTWSLYVMLYKSPEIAVFLKEKKIQPHHVSIKTVIAAEFFWLYNVRDVNLDEEHDYKQIREICQNSLDIIFKIFDDLLPEGHPARSEERKLLLADRVRGSSNAPKVIVRFLYDEQEILAEITAGSVNIKDFSGSGG